MISLMYLQFLACLIYCIADSSLRQEAKTFVTGHSKLSKTYMATDLDISGFLNGSVLETKPMPTFVIIFKRFRQTRFHRRVGLFVYVCMYINAQY